MKLFILSLQETSQLGFYILDKLIFSLWYFIDSDQTNLQCFRHRILQSYLSFSF